MDLLNNIVESDDVNNVGSSMVIMVFIVFQLVFGLLEMVDLLLVKNFYYCLEVEDFEEGEIILVSLFLEEQQVVNELYICKDLLLICFNFDFIYGDLFVENQVILLLEVQVGIYYIFVYSVLGEDL